MSTSIPSQVLPILRIQCDWEEDTKKPGHSSFWVSYESGTPTKLQIDISDGKAKNYGNIDVMVKEEKNLHFEAQSGFQITSFDPHSRWIEIQSPDNKLRTKFISPIQTYPLHAVKKGAFDVDISPGGELGVSGSVYGDLKCWNTNDGVVLREFQGHVGDILVCRFFPSGQVILSGSNDCQLKIWSVTEGYCAATLVGHSGSILDSAFIERGRNFVSCSSDGTLRLWETSTKQTVAVLAKRQAINTCWVCTNANHPVQASEPGPMEYGTGGKIVLYGGEDKSFCAVDVASKSQVFEYQCDSSVESCTSLESKYYIVGTSKGDVLVFDSAKTSEPLFAFNKARSPIQSLAPQSASQFWAGTRDGVTVLWDVLQNQQVAQLTGPDLEPVTAISSRGQEVYTSSRDSKVRKYTLS